MEEVDGILIYTLKQIGCDTSSKVSELTPVQIIQCVSKCLELIGADTEVPNFDKTLSMSARYKLASQLAQAVTNLGFKDEIGCQSFLYPTELETRKLLIFMVEKLPRDSEVGDQIETLLSKIAQEKTREELEEAESMNNGFEVDGIQLPIAVDVDSLPKETLKFYASHLAELTFAKTREKYRNKPQVKPIVPEVTPINQTENWDDDFEDPEIHEAITQSPVTEFIEKPTIKEKPKLLEKPKPKPTIAEKPKLDNKEKDDAEAAMAEKTRQEAEAAVRIKALQENTKEKVRLLKEKEKLFKGSSVKISQLQEEAEQLRIEMERKEKVIDRLKKTHQLLSGDDDGFKKVKDAVENQMEKLMNLSNQWEKHRKPLVDEIRNKKSSNQMVLTEAAKMREELRNMKLKMKEMGQDARSKEEACKQLQTEYEKLPKDLSRSSYTRRICEIIGNIKKQKREITKVLKDTKDIQKDINTLSGRLDRTFAVADELIFKDAEKDKNVAQSYKLLVAIHSDFSRIIKTLEEIGNSKRHQRDLEDKLELERGKNVEDKLKRLKADMNQMQHENKILEAKLRDPTLHRKA